MRRVLYVVRSLFFCALPLARAKAPVHYALASVLT